jgi:hypothetical protein
MKRKTARKTNLSTTKTPAFWLVLATLLVVVAGTAYRLMLRPSSINRISTPAVAGFGKSLQLDNVGYNDTYLQKANPSLIFSHNPFTVETWIKLSKPAAFVGFKQYPLVSYTRSDAPDASYNQLFRLAATFFQEDPTKYAINFSAYIDNPKDIQAGNNFVSANSSATLLADDWNHVAVVSYSEGNYCKLEIYLNGILSTTSTSTYHQNCQISTRLPQDLLVGKPGPLGGGNPQDYFSGQLDDIRISSFRRYTSNFTVPTSTMQVDDGTMVLYNFENSLADATRFNNTLTAVGTRYTYAYHTQPKPPRPSFVPLETVRPMSSSLPRSSCKPRPACLDAKPSCKLPITADMCAPSKVPVPSGSALNAQ